MNIPSNHYMYCLSYDITSTSEDVDEVNNANLELKKLIVWEIIVEGKGLFLVSPVGSTIIFESPKNYDFWKENIQNFGDKMNFVLSQIAESEVGENTKKVAVVMSMNDDLDNNFQEKVVEYCERDYQYLMKSNRKPGTKH
ncbi:MAG: superfamily I DNA and/or RNA helicase [Crocinitomix sp.]|jgi:superfamily I DNA and/or RNA helicase